jgi:hypothetical protein
MLLTKERNEMFGLVEHNCPVEGVMLVEKDKACNWCCELGIEENLSLYPSYTAPVGQV